MAILVNFGLVIARPIVGFADGMTAFFVRQINQGDVAGALTNAFAPQSLWAPPTVGATLSPATMLNSCANSRIAAVNPVARGMIKRILAE